MRPRFVRSQGPRACAPSLLSSASATRRSERWCGRNDSARGEGPPRRLRGVRALSDSARSFCRSSHLWVGKTGKKWGPELDGLLAAGQNRQSCHSGAAWLLSSCLKKPGLMTRDEAACVDPATHLLKGIGSDSGTEKGRGGMKRDPSRANVETDFIPSGGATAQHGTGADKSLRQGRGSRLFSSDGGGRQGH